MSAISDFDCLISFTALLQAAFSFPLFVVNRLWIFARSYFEVDYAALINSIKVEFAFPLKEYLLLKDSAFHLFIWDAQKMCRCDVHFQREELWFPHLLQQWEQPRLKVLLL